MTEHKADRAFADILRRFEPESTLLRAWPLAGGVSAQVTALEVERPQDQRRTLLVRQHGAIDLQHNPHIAADEFRLLAALHAHGLPVPAPYYFDESGQVLPTPYIVLEYIEGDTGIAPGHVAGAMPQLAAQLARIHALDCTALDLGFLPDQQEALGKRLRVRPARLDDSLSEGRIRAALEAAWPLPQPREPVLLHGDFWPGNTVWRDGQLVAVIDWEDAALGDPLSDLADARLELLWAFGAEAMHTFTAHYMALTGADSTNLPYWDLYAALRPAGKLGTWGLDAVTEQRMRAQHRWFVSRALEQLATR